MLHGGHPVGHEPMLLERHYLRHVPSLPTNDDRIGQKQVVLDSTYFKEVVITVSTHIIILFE
jgi:hypothetical protein